MPGSSSNGNDSARNTITDKDYDNWIKSIITSANLSSNKQFNQIIQGTFQATGISVAEVRAIAKEVNNIQTSTAVNMLLANIQVPAEMDKDILKAKLIMVITENLNKANNDIKAVINPKLATLVENVYTDELLENHVYDINDKNEIKKRVLTTLTSTNDSLLNNTLLGKLTLDTLNSLSAKDMVAKLDVLKNILKSLNNTIVDSVNSESEKLKNKLHAPNNLPEAIKAELVKEIEDEIECNILKTNNIFLEALEPSLAIEVRNVFTDNITLKPTYTDSDYNVKAGEILSARTYNSPVVDSIFKNTFNVDSIRNSEFSTLVEIINKLREIHTNQDTVAQNESTTSADPFMDTDKLKTAIINKENELINNVANDIMSVINPKLLNPLTDILNGDMTINYVYTSNDLDSVVQLTVNKVFDTNKDDEIKSKIDKGTITANDLSKKSFSELVELINELKTNVANLNTNVETNGYDLVIDDFITSKPASNNTIDKATIVGKASTTIANNYNRSKEVLKLAISSKLLNPVNDIFTEELVEKPVYSAEEILEVAKELVNALDSGDETSDKILKGSLKAKNLNNKSIENLTTIVNNFKTVNSSDLMNAKIETVLRPGMERDEVLREARSIIDANISKANDILKAKINPLIEPEVGNVFNEVLTPLPEYQDDDYNAVVSSIINNVPDSFDTSSNVIKNQFDNFDQWALEQIIESVTPIKEFEFSEDSIELNKRKGMDVERIKRMLNEKLTEVKSTLQTRVLDKFSDRFKNTVTDLYNDDLALKPVYTNSDIINTATSLLENNTFSSNGLANLILKGKLKTFSTVDGNQTKADVLKLREAYNNLDNLLDTIVTANNVPEFMPLEAVRRELRHLLDNNLTNTTPLVTNALNPLLKAEISNLITDEINVRPVYSLAQVKEEAERFIREYYLETADYMAPLEILPVLKTGITTTELNDKSPAETVELIEKVKLANLVDLADRLVTNNNDHILDSMNTDTLKAEIVKLFEAKKESSKPAFVEKLDNQTVYTVTEPYRDNLELRPTYTSQDYINKAKAILANSNMSSNIYIKESIKNESYDVELTKDYDFITEVIKAYRILDGIKESEISNLTLQADPFMDRNLLKTELTNLFNTRFNSLKEKLTENDEIDRLYLEDLTSANILSHNLVKNHILTEDDYEAIMRTVISLTNGKQIGFLNDMLVANRGIDDYLDDGFESIEGYRDLMKIFNDYINTENAFDTVISDEATKYKTNIHSRELPDTITIKEKILEYYNPKIDSAIDKILPVLNSLSVTPAEKENFYTHVFVKNYEYTEADYTEVANNAMTAWISSVEQAGNINNVKLLLESKINTIQSNTYETVFAVIEEIKNYIQSLNIDTHLDTLVTEPIATKEGTVTSRDHMDKTRVIEKVKAKYNELLAKAKNVLKHKINPYLVTPANDVLVDELVKNHEINENDYNTILTNTVNAIINENVDEFYIRYMKAESPDTADIVLATNDYAGVVSAVNEWKEKLEALNEYASNKLDSEKESYLSTIHTNNEFDDSKLMQMFVSVFNSKADDLNKKIIPKIQPYVYNTITDIFNDTLTENYIYTENDYNSIINSIWEEFTFVNDNNPDSDLSKFMNKDTGSIVFNGFSDIVNKITKLKLHYNNKMASIESKVNTKVSEVEATKTSNNHLDKARIVRALQAKMNDVYNSANTSLTTVVNPLIMTPVNDVFTEPMIESYVYTEEDYTSIINAIKAELEAEHNTLFTTAPVNSNTWDTLTMIIREIKASMRSIPNSITSKINAKVAEKEATVTSKDHMDKDRITRELTQFYNNTLDSKRNVIKPLIEPLLYNTVNDVFSDNLVKNYVYTEFDDEALKDLVWTNFLSTYNNKADKDENIYNILNSTYTNPTNPSFSIYDSFITKYKAERSSLIESLNTVKERTVGEWTRGKNAKVPFDPTNLTRLLNEKLTEVETLFNNTIVPDFNRYLYTDITNVLTDTYKEDYTYTEEDYRIVKENIINAFTDVLPISELTDLDISGETLIGYVNALKEKYNDRLNVISELINTKTSEYEETKEARHHMNSNQISNEVSPEFLNRINTLKQSLTNALNPLLYRSVTDIFNEELILSYVFTEEDNQAIVDATTNHIETDIISASSFTDLYADTSIDMSHMTYEQLIPIINAFKNFKENYANTVNTKVNELVRAKESSVQSLNSMDKSAITRSIDEYFNETFTEMKRTLTTVINPLLDDEVTDIFTEPLVKKRTYTKQDYINRALYLIQQNNDPVYRSLVTGTATLDTLKEHETDTVISAAIGIKNGYNVQDGDLLKHMDKQTLQDTVNEEIEKIKTNIKPLLESHLENRIEKIIEPYDVFDESTYRADSGAEDAMYADVCREILANFSINQIPNDSALIDMIASRRNKEDLNKTPEEEVEGYDLNQYFNRVRGIFNEAVNASKNFDNYLDNIIDNQVHRIANLKRSKVREILHDIVENNIGDYISYFTDKFTDDIAGVVPYDLTTEPWEFKHIYQDSEIDTIVSSVVAEYRASAISEYVFNYLNHRFDPDGPSTRSALELVSAINDTKDFLEQYTTTLDDTLEAIITSYTAEHGYSSNIDKNVVIEKLNKWFADRKTLVTGIVLPLINPKLVNPVDENTLWTDNLEVKPDEIDTIYEEEAIKIIREFTDTNELGLDPIVIKLLTGEMQLADLTDVNVVKTLVSGFNDSKTDIESNLNTKADQIEKPEMDIERLKNKITTIINRRKSNANDIAVSYLTNKVSPEVTNIFTDTINENYTYTDTDYTNKANDIFAHYHDKFTSIAFPTETVLRTYVADYDSPNEIEILSFINDTNDVLSKFNNVTAENTSLSIYNNLKLALDEMKADHSAPNDASIVKLAAKVKAKFTESMAEFNRTYLPVFNKLLRQPINNIFTDNFVFKTLYTDEDYTRHAQDVFNRRDLTKYNHTLSDYLVGLVTNFTVNDAPTIIEAEDLKTELTTAKANIISIDNYMTTHSDELDTKILVDMDPTIFKNKFKEIVENQFNDKITSITNSFSQLWLNPVTNAFTELDNLIIEASEEDYIAKAIEILQLESFDNVSENVREIVVENFNTYAVIDDNVYAMTDFNEAKPLIRTWIDNSVAKVPANTPSNMSSTKLSSMISQLYDARKTAIADIIYNTLSEDRIINPTPDNRVSILDQDSETILLPSDAVLRSANELVTEFETTFKNKDDYSDWIKHIFRKNTSQDTITDDQVIELINMIRTLRNDGIEITSLLGNIDTANQVFADTRLPKIYMDYYIKLNWEAWTNAWEVAIKADPYYGPKIDPLEKLMNGSGNFAFITPEGSDADYLRFIKNNVVFDVVTDNPYYRMIVEGVFGAELIINSANIHAILEGIKSAHENFLTRLDDFIESYPNVESNLRRAKLKTKFRDYIIDLIGRMETVIVRRLGNRFSGNRQVLRSDDYTITIPDDMILKDDYLRHAMLNMVDNNAFNGTGVESFLKHDFDLRTVLATTETLSSYINNVRRSGNLEDIVKAKAQAFRDD